MNLSTDESAWKLLCQKTVICRVLKGARASHSNCSLSPRALEGQRWLFFYLVVIRRIGERTKSSQERFCLLCFVGQGFKGFAKLCLFFIIYFSEYVVFNLRFTYICINEIRFQDLRLRSLKQNGNCMELVLKCLLTFQLFKVCMNPPMDQYILNRIMIIVVLQKRCTCEAA